MLDLDSFVLDILKSCFKSLNKTRLNSLSKAIVCVALGLRVSHLLDIAHLDLNEAKTLTSRLAKHPSCRSLRLLQFKDRFTFLCNINRLDRHLESTIRKPAQWIFISVEGKEPIKLNEPPCHLLDWLQRPSLTLGSSLYLYSPIVPPFMVALTGWLLEYPVIYTTHLDTDDPEVELDEWEPRSNCLGGQSLQVVQVWLKDHMLLSFSYPPSLLLKNVESDLKRKIDQRLVEMSYVPDWLMHVRCDIKREQVKLDRFAL